MEHVNSNIRYLVKLMGGVDKFLAAFKRSPGKYSIYAYTKESSPTKPPLKLMQELAAYFDIPLDDLYTKDLKKSGWVYKPKGLPKLTGKFIDGPKGYTYRVFQVIELLQKRHFMGSLADFVKTLDTYKDSYAAIANMKQARQKATAELISEIKEKYPEVNTNFIHAAEEPVFLERKQDDDKLAKRVEQLVAESIAKYGKKGARGINQPSSD